MAGGADPRPMKGTGQAAASGSCRLGNSSGSRMGLSIISQGYKSHSELWAYQV